MTQTLVSAGGAKQAAMQTQEHSVLRVSLDDESEKTSASAVKPKSMGRRVLGWSLILAFLVPLLAVFGGMSAANADDEAELDGMSFYEVSAELMNLFSTVQDPSIETDEGTNGPWGAHVPAHPGTAGSFIGYLDTNILESPSRWALSQLSGSSDAMGYENLQIYDEDGSPRQRSEQGFQNYAYYGAALNGLGFDNTSTGLSMNLGNVVMGAVMYAAYHIVYIVDIVFWLFMNLLQALNPFRLFYFGMYAISPELANGMTGGAGATTLTLFPGTPFAVETDALAGLVNWIGGWYQVLVSMAWAAIVPIFIGVFLIGIVLFKKMDKGSATKKLLIRLMFIGFGLPLFGSLYSATLSTMTDGLGAGNRGASQVVMSTYIDFETWVKRDRLGLPDGAVVEWDTRTNQPTGNSEACARNTALLVNSVIHGLGSGGITTTCGTSGGNTNADIWSGAVDHSNSSSGLLDSYTDSGSSNSAWSGGGSAPSDGAIIRDMLGRYMSGAQVTAASFETEIKAAMISQASPNESDDDYGSGVRYGHVIDWFDEIGDYESGVEEDMPGNPLIAVAGGNSGLQVNSSNSTQNNVAFETRSTSGVCDNYRVWAPGSNGSPADCNMGVLATYNYLNTGFDNTALTVYSSGNVMSEATREIHTSVNSVGTGVMSFLYWMNSLTLLGAFIVVGITYAFAMLFGSLKRGFQLIGSIPFATLGVLSGIAKVIIYSMALILEVLLTIFVYLIVQEFLLSLPQVIEAPLASILSNLGSGALPGPFDGLAALFTGGVLAMIVPIFSIAATLAFTVMALRLRKTIIKAADEAVTKMVEKFLDTGASPATAGGGGGLGQGIGSGLGGAAGMAAANRMMTRDSGNQGGGPNASGTNGPKGVSSTPGGSGGTGSDGGGGRGGGRGGGGGIPGGAAAGALSAGSGKNSASHGAASGATTGAMGRASDDQAEGNLVAKNGLSMDGKGHGPKSDSKSISSELASDAREVKPGENIKEGAGSSSKESATDSQGMKSDTQAISSELASDAREVRPGESMKEGAQSSSAESSERSSSNSEVATAESGRDSQSSESAQRQVEADRDSRTDASSETGATSSSETATQSQNERGATNTVAAGETAGKDSKSALSDRERAEAQSASQTDTAQSSAESQSDSAQQNQQESSATREVAAGESSRTEATQSDSSTARDTEAGADSRTDTAAQSEQSSAQTQRETDQQQDSSATREVSAGEANAAGSGVSVENTSNESKVKAEGDEQKTAQDNRADNKNLSEQNTDQSSATEQNVENKEVAADEAKDAKGKTAEAGVAGAAATKGAKGTKAEPTDKKSVQGSKEGAKDSAKKPATTKASAAPKGAAKGATDPKGSAKGTGEAKPKGVAGAKPGVAKAAAKGAGVRKPPSAVTRTAGGTIKGGVVGGAKGAAKGAVVGGARGVIGGPKGIAAGAAVGAKGGAVRGAAVGATKGGIKAAATKPKSKNPPAAAKPKGSQRPPAAAQAKGSSGSAAPRQAPQPARAPQQVSNPAPSQTPPQPPRPATAAPRKVSMTPVSPPKAAGAPTPVQKSRPTIPNNVRPKKPGPSDSL